MTSVDVAARRLVTISLERRRSCRWLLLPAAQAARSFRSHGRASRASPRRACGRRRNTRASSSRRRNPSRIDVVDAQGSAPGRARSRRRRAHAGARAAPVARAGRPTRTSPAIRFGTSAPDTLRIVFDLKTETRTAALRAEAGRRVRLSRRARSLSAHAARSADGAARGEARRAGAERKPPRRRAGRAMPDAEAPMARADQGRPQDHDRARSRATAARIPGAIGRRGTYEKNVTLAIGKKLKRIIDAEPGMRAMLTRDDDYYVPLAARVQKARRVRGRPLRLDPRRRVPRAAARAARRCSRCPKAARPAPPRGGSRRRENAADLIGGVNLDGRDPVLARTLLDLSQTAQISDSLKVGRHVLDRHRHDQSAAQAGRSSRPDSRC